jgi:ABC-2 type transport system permease protein
VAARPAPLRRGGRMIMYFRLVWSFIAASAQQETAYRANFFISLLHTLLNFGTGLLGLVIIFDQVEAVQGWDYPAALAVLGVYLTISALRDLVISPSLDSLAGLDGEIWRGTFDFVLLRPVNTQFLASLRQWRIFATFDLLLGLLVIGVASQQLAHALTLGQIVTFLLTLYTSILTVYAIFLAFSSMMFWSPGFLFTWVFNGLFQMARYPVGVYPGVLRRLLTWVVPIGIITTVPAQALTGELTLPLLMASLIFGHTLFIGASWLFRAALKRYSSASS